MKTEGDEPAGDDGMPFMIDRFVIEDELGAGGMGRVYLAYDPSLDRKVAVKVLRETIGTDRVKARARLAREARAMAKLHHPNVVTVHEVGSHDDNVFIVMEYVPGGTLRDWLRRTPDAGWREIVEIYARAGRGLAAAHAAGLVHRDFKPDNVLVAEDGRVLVSDFGIADIRAEGRAPSVADATGSVMGTPPYMAPEQRLGGGAEPASDQFAFCAALYEALYGTLPFAGDLDHGGSELAAPVRDPGVPAYVAAAVRKGLAPAPAARFGSLGALLDQLTRRRTRAKIAGVALGSACALAAAIWLGARVVAGPAHAPQAAGLVAIEPLRLTLPSHPPPPEWSDAYGDMLALLLGDIAGVKAVGPTYLLGADALREAHDAPLAPAAWRDAEAKASARFVVRAAIDEHGDQIIATLELVTDGHERAIHVARPRDQLPQLLEDSADAIARAIDAGALDREHATNRARALYAIGNDHLRDGDFQVARAFLEQATAADPSYFDAWYALALARSWVFAPDAQVTAAIDAARAKAPTPTSRRLVDGAAQLLRHDLVGARATLAELVNDPALSPIERRDALYFLGEAHWHDGHHKVGFGYLQQAFELDPRFKLPVQHLADYAIANRDLALIRQYAPVRVFSSSELRGATEFVLGHYDDLARTGTGPIRLFAALVAQQAPTPEMVAFLDRDEVDRQNYRAAVALGDGNTAAAKAELDALWSAVDRRERSGDVSDATYFSLKLTGDLVIAAGNADEARRVVEYLAKHAHAGLLHAYPRLSILAAPVVGDASWIVRDGLSDRERGLADAIEAEMNGNRARAVELLTPIVRDPSPSWDFPERIALLRNLRALHRDREARALCDDTLRPAIFQWSFLAARYRCTH